MKIIKKMPYVLMLVCTTLLLGCLSGEKKNDTTDDQEGYQKENQENVQNRISTYEIHISGGKFDGQNFSGSFPNDGDHGQGQLSSQVANNLSNDEVNIRFMEEKTQGNYISGNAKLVLDDNGKPFPIVNSEDFLNENTSRIFFQIGDNIDARKGHQISSKSGTVSLSNLKMEGDATKTFSTMIDCDVTFDAEFNDIELGTGEAPQAVPVTIKGEFHIKSIRQNQDD